MKVDVIVVGAGAAGLNAALAAKERGLRSVVLEKSKLANTIEDFPEGKWVYAEPDSTPPKGKLWLDGARKEDLLARREVLDKEMNHVREELRDQERRLDRREATLDEQQQDIVKKERMLEVTQKKLAERQRHSVSAAIRAVVGDALRGER